MKFVKFGFYKLIIPAFVFILMQSPLPVGADVSIEKSMGEERFTLPSIRMFTQAQRQSLLSSRRC